MEPLLRYKCHRRGDKMKKKKGFTLIEIIVTFSLISVVVILLFEIIISLREVYIKGDFQTTLLSKQGIITQKINADLETLKLKKITSCGAFCITFEYQTGDRYNLSLNLEKNHIQYHDYTWELKDGSTIGQVETSIYQDQLIHTTDIENAILKIDIPIHHKLLEKDYGIHMIYQYNTAITSIPNRISKPTNITEEQHQKYSFFR